MHVVNTNVEYILLYEMFLKNISWFWEEKVTINFQAHYNRKYEVPL